MFEVLSNRNARLYLIGQTLSVYGDTALWLAAGVWVKSLTGSSSAAGMVFFAYAFAQLFSPLSGLVVDRVRRRPLLVATNLVTAVVVLALLAVRDADHVWLVYVVMLLYGASNTILGSAQSALLTVMLPQDKLGQANGLLQSVNQGIRLLGPLSGAAIFAWAGGAELVIYIDVATFLAAALFIGLLKVQETAPEPTDHGWWSEVTSGLRHLAGQRSLRQLTVAVGAAAMFFGFLESLMFAVLEHGLHRPAAFMGVLGAIQGVGGIVGGVTAGWIMQRTSEGLTVTIGMLTYALGVSLIAVPAQVPVFAGMAACGLSLPWLISGILTLLQRSTPQSLQGRAFAALNLVLGVPQTLSIAFGAALLAVADYRILLAAVAVAFAGGGIYLAGQRNLRRRVEQADHPAAEEIPNGMRGEDPVSA